LEEETRWRWGLFKRDEMIKRERERERERGEAGCLVFKPLTLEEKKGIPSLLHISYRCLSLFFSTAILAAIIPS
jgi:hypothetical protein